MNQTDGSFPASTMIKAWQVLRYCRREGPHWVPVDDGSGAYTLQCCAGLMMLVQGGTVLESLPLSNPTQMHAIVKGDTLLIAVKHQTIGRKFKVRLSSAHATQNCMQFLQNFFPVKDITKPEENVPISLGQMYEQLMQSSPSDCIPILVTDPDPLPTSFPLEETLQMCILDPSFPNLVARVADIMAQLDLSKETNQ